MYVTYDKAADAMYISLSDEETGELRTQAVKNWLLIDFDSKGRVCGFEILDVNRHCILKPCDIKDIKFVDLNSPEGETFLTQKERVKTS